MIEFAAALEATALAQFLKRSRWVYPLVNAGHVMGIALLVGAVLPMNVALWRGRAALWLRPWAMTGMALAALCGVMLFVTQATDYAASPWFQAKMALLALAVANAAWHLTRPPSRAALAVSLALWPAVLLLGRMVAYG